MKAAGVAENNVYARESGYSNAIENSAIIGTAPEFVYTDGLSVEEVTVKFELESSAVSNTLGTYAENNDGFKGIKRLMVFMFFEDVNMLLPVETEYDEANNTVSATTDRVGTYCLMDMEMLFKNLGIEPDNSKTQQISAQALDKAQIMPYNGNELVNQGMYSNGEGETDSGDDDSKDHFDVAFIVGEVGYDKSQLEGICSEIKAISGIIFERSNDVTISIYGLDGSGNTQSEWYGRADSIENVKVMLEKIKPKEVQNENGMVVVSECVDYVTLAHKNTESEERRNRAEYCFMFFDPLYQIEDGYNVFQYLAQSPRTDEYGMKLLEAISKDGTDIDFSTVTSCYSTIEEMTSSYAKQVSLKTNGINIEDISPESIVDASIKHIYGMSVYKAIIATGYRSVLLKKELTQYDMELAEKRYDDPDYVFSKEELSKCADTDGDGLYDFEEVMFYSKKLGKHQLITFENNEIKLPSVNTVVNALDELAYVQSGQEKTIEQYGDSYDEFLCLSVLPIKSDPTNEDSDNDGLLDGKAQDYKGKIIAPQDKEPLKVNGPLGVWQRYINEMSSSEVPHLYSDPFMKIDWGNALANGIIKSPFATMAGADLLNFDFDEQHMALHAHPFTWQWLGGYTDFYDSVFEWATGGNMDRLKLPFTNSKNELYYLWCWRGDYINLGSGAEFGIYKKSFIPGESYATFTLPMTLSLYNYNENGIDTIFNWAPDEEQWWITGWNPEYMRPNKYEMVMVGSIDFTGHEDMFDSLTDRTQKNSDKILYDDESLTIWIIWHDIIQ